MSTCPPFEAITCADDPDFVGPLGVGCLTNEIICLVDFVANGCPVTCGTCVVEEPWLPLNFGTCMTFIEPVRDVANNRIAVFLATHTEVAAFQFSLMFDGAALTSPIAGEGGLASQMDVQGGSTGNIVGVSLADLATIEACSWNLLTELSLKDDTEVFPEGDLCIENIIVSTKEGNPIPSFSYCEQNQMCTSLTFPPPPEPPVPEPSPPPGAPKTECMPDPVECVDTPNYQGPIGVGCETNIFLCESFPQVALDCPVTCNACGPEAPELPKTFGGCEGFIDAVNEVTTISIFVGSCDDITGFQFTLSIEDELVAAPIEGTGGLASQFAVSGINGVITGVALGNSEVIIAGTYDLLTTLQLSDFEDFAEGAVCLTSIILENSNGDEIPSFSPCLIGAECLIEGITPPSAPVTMSVASDPHFFGVHGQTYDVTGVSGHIYNIVRDHDLQVNALLVTAYTTGIYLDSHSQEMRKFRPKGTWMVSIGIVMSGPDSQTSQPHSVVITTEHPQYDFCALKPMECIVGGSVQIDDMETVLTGSYMIGELGEIRIQNQKKISRAILDTDAIQVEIDFVPPPEEWEVDESQVQELSHLNMQIKRVALSEVANGLLGASVRVKKDNEGRDIMHAYDKNGAGILDGPVSAYEVESITDFLFPLYSKDLYTTS